MTNFPIETSAGQVSEERLREILAYYEMGGIGPMPVPTQEESLSLLRELLSARTVAPFGYVILSKLGNLNFTQDGHHAEKLRGEGVEVTTVYASPPQPEVRVTVKPLEWRARQANSIIGFYRVEEVPRVGWWWGCEGIRRNLEPLATESEAKAAAQSDYETRIRSALAASIPDSAPTPERKMQIGVAYADESPITDERLDFLARFGSLSETNTTELRYMAEELHQRRMGEELRLNLAKARRPAHPSP